MMPRPVLLVLLCACAAPEAAPGPAPTPNIDALDCYAKERQGVLLLDTERWDPGQALEQYLADQRKGVLPAGCWANSPPKCDETCK